MCVLKRGCEFNEVSRELFCLNNFDRQCGTSLAYRAKLYKAFGEERPSMISLVELGSHTLIKQNINNRNVQKVELFDRLACYRMAHQNSSTSQIRHLNKTGLILDAKQYFKHATRRRADYLNVLKSEFGQQV